MNSVGSLFSGCGGLDLGFELADFETKWFAEIDKYCDRILNKNYPGIPNLGDVNELEVEKLKDYSLAIKMYEKGNSIQQVADYYSVSRQSMWKSLQRRGVKFRSNLKFGEENHFYRGGSTEDGYCQNLTEEAIERGLLIRPDECENCGENYRFTDGRTAIQAHHVDYNNHMNIMWLCQKCHHEWHKNNKAILRDEVMPNEVPQVDVLIGGFP